MFRTAPWLIALLLFVGCKPDAPGDDDSAAGDDGFSHTYVIEAEPGGPRGLPERELFHVARDPNETEDVLEQKYHYHFHKLPDADRAEIINMINNYTREAILPPIVEKSPPA